MITWLNIILPALGILAGLGYLIHLSALQEEDRRVSRLPPGYGLHSNPPPLHHSLLSSARPNV